MKYLLPVLLITACTSMHEISWDSLKKKLPPEPSCKKNVDKTISVSGTFDGKGCMYVWTGKNASKCHGDEEVSEKEARMFVMKPGSTLKNVVIDCSPDGIEMDDNTTIDNVFIRDCGEDCVTTGGKNNVIKNSKFYRCDDKCIQLNGPASVKLSNNEFHYGKIPLGGSSHSSGGAHPIEVSGNKFFDSKTVILSQRNHEFHVKNNEARNIECFFETKEEGVVYNEGEQKISGGSLMCNRGTKNVKGKK